MADSLYPEAQVELYEEFIFPLCFMASVCVMFALWALDHRCNTRIWEPLAVTFPVLGTMASMPLTPYIIHYGLPKWMTFGVQVGKILPATCEGVQALVGVDKGSDMLPCHVYKLNRWLSKIAQDDGSWHLEAFDPRWSGWIILAVLGLAGLVFCYLVSNISVRVGV